MLGDVDHYQSPYMLGVKAAMTQLGYAHAEVSLRQSARTIRQRVELFQPDVLWTHMLLWPPMGSPTVNELIEIVSAAARRGSRVLVHDGDAKRPNRYPRSIASWCSLALVNHAYDRAAWGVPTLRWPYFAAMQRAIAQPVANLRCQLFFAGTVGGGMYSARSRLLAEIQARGVALRFPAAGANTIGLTPEIAASADAVLGFGRPDVPGWVDTRVFQYPGAGGILLHDDVQGYLEPWVHFVPYASGSAESVVDALDKLRALSDAKRLAIRRRAFEYVQARHSALARVSEVLYHPAVAVAA
jgi:hypothetical protein